jgi:hypothetical protein
MIEHPSLQLDSPNKEVADAIDDSSRSTTGSIRSRRSRGTTSSRLSQAAELWLDVADIEQSII